MNEILFKFTPFYFVAQNPCQNHACVYGTCVRVNSDDYTCNCNDGYYGEFCQCKYSKIIGVTIMMGIIWNTVNASIDYRCY